MIYITEGKLYTTLFTKPTDKHMYQNYNSEHPPSLKKSIPYSQFLRLKSILSYSIYWKLINMHIYFLWRD